MNTLILYWNSVLSGTRQEPSLVNQPHSVQEYAAFRRSLNKSTPMEATMRAMRPFRVAGDVVSSIARWK